MFSRIKNAFRSLYEGFTARISALFGQKTIDEQTLTELEKILLAADTGVPTTRYLMQEVRAQHQRGALTHGDDLKKSLASLLTEILTRAVSPTIENIIVLVGVNGSGKTTCAGKLAHLYAQQGKKVVLVAADTFRAAATEQLHAWASQTSARFVQGTPSQDPASVVFVGCETFKKEQCDVMIIDTAGRLQTNVNLMHELAKIKRILAKQLPNTPISTLLVLDSMLGQNSFEQAKLFKESTDVNGIILTKMDGTAKGGIVFAIAHTLSIPVVFITFGEEIDAIKPFDKEAYVDSLLTK